MVAIGLAPPCSAAAGGWHLCETCHGNVTAHMSQNKKPRLSEDCTFWSILFALVFCFLSGGASECSGNGGLLLSLPFLFGAMASSGNYAGAGFSHPARLLGSLPCLLLVRGCLANVWQTTTAAKDSPKTKMAEAANATDGAGGAAVSGAGQAAVPEPLTEENAGKTRYMPHLEGYKFECKAAHGE